MNSLTPPSELQARDCQIVAGGLVAGAFAYGVIAVGIGSQQAGLAPGEVPVASLVLVGFAALTLCGLFIVPGLLVRQLLATGSSELKKQWFLKTVLQLALCEGACFASLTGYLAEQQWWSLAIAVVCLFLMLINFPTQSRLEQFIENQTAFGGSE